MGEEKLNREDRKPNNTLGKDNYHKYLQNYILQPGTFIRIICIKMQAPAFVP